MIQIGAPTATIDTPVEHLTACHRRIEQKLDALVTAADHLDSDRQAALRAIANSIQFLDSSGVLHTEDEEQSVFPRLRPSMSAEENAFVEQLEAQHSEAEAIYAELKTLAEQLRLNTTAQVDSYRTCATRLRSLYRDHIRSEDDILTPIAKRTLTPAELVLISQEMRERRQALSKK
jgi:hemerythrin-like domain-containing protein